MLPFSYRRAQTAEQAVREAGAGAPAGVRYLAGATTLADLMKLGVMTPEGVVDITPLRAAGHGAIEADSTGLRLGALVRMADAQEDPAILSDYPVIADALRLAASQQIRNMATLGGNILQRTRCAYFREPSWPCNKRNPGSGCAALQGVNRTHAVLGGSGACVATYPGDLAQALIALDAMVETLGSRGVRRVPFERLHVLPGETPHVETVLAPDELITFIGVPAGPWTRRSRYLKVRDRQSYAFALASAAVALDLDGDVVRAARIALGGVATIPWRAREAEGFLANKRLDPATAQQAAELAFRAAAPLEHNAFKLPLGKATLVRALLETQTMRL